MTASVAPTFDAVLRAAAVGDDTGARLVDRAGRWRPLDPLGWHAKEIPGDTGLLSRTSGSTLDVGCGPGRLTAALAGRGRIALGIDVSRAAVRSTLRRGGPALLSDVFAPLPLEGSWRSVLLADGNIGIGGDPIRLLRRCAGLLTPDGRIIAELDPPGMPFWAGEVRLHTHHGAESPPLRWAYVGVDDIAAVAAAAAMRVHSTWTEANRWFATLTRP
ncbi:methyltransferase family protein [Asanoa ferruginea]|uniref:Methyltransferase family protein n=1 Tax=Asanoa ferruginea TaxID=53367 RepID=A0A3D9ZSV3_9ACTN|nr:methyltransferase domain-containing protein [Asanoa ferruginea]REF99674.1 methyltransferase family protein [Asanoa ferruginea]GIF52069.1 methyltransferase type 12 [Asanoa ferruginea]